VAKAHDFVGVGSNDNSVECGAGFCGFVDPREHGATGDKSKNLAWKPSGGKTGGDDSESTEADHTVHVSLTSMSVALRITSAALIWF